MSWQKVKSFKLMRILMISFVYKFRGLECSHMSVYIKSVWGSYGIFHTLLCAQYLPVLYMHLNYFVPVLDNRLYCAYVCVSTYVELAQNHWDTYEVRIRCVLCVRLLITKMSLQMPLSWHTYLCDYTIRLHIDLWLY